MSKVHRLIVSLFVMTVVLSCEGANAPGRRRALLIGIDDYSASRLTKPPDAVPPPRDRVWPQLGGTVNDVAILQEMLVWLYGFDRKDIVVLTNQSATRAAIFSQLETLIASSSKGDVVLFYYAGHGSKVSNPGPEERDRMDESVLPADSRLGAPDIRDKELRRRFNRILDRGARLSVILDTCFSGSGSRDVLPFPAQVRAVAPDRRPVHDRSKDGPWPESRGALVLSATDDESTAAEIRDTEGRFHGAFSWAWFSALCGGGDAEPARDTFLRARARLQMDRPTQEPVLAGNDEAQLTPFLGVRRDRQNGRTVVAVEKVEDDGTIVVQGGWVNGLGVGSILEGGGLQLEVTSVEGIAKCRARVIKRAPKARLESGSLVHVVGWVAPPQRPMRVFIPGTSATAAELIDSAKAIAEGAARRKLVWVDDPTERLPEFIIRRNDSGWELVSADGRTRHTSAKPVDLLKTIRARASLFVQLSIPESLVKQMGIRPESKKEGVARVMRPQEADYILTGRYAAAGHLEYGWIRAAGTKTDSRKSGLPVRTDWKPPSAIALRDMVVRLRRIHAWLSLDSPPGMQWPYALAVRREKDRALTEGTLIGGEPYGFVMRARGKTIPLPHRRYAYVFCIDSLGRGILLYPTVTGSVDNRFPLSPPPNPPDAEIALGPSSMFRTLKPYGVETYLLLTTDQVIPSPSAVFNFEGVKTTNTRGGSALEQLLLQVGDATRAVDRIPTPPEWSIERIVFESVAGDS